MAELVVIPPRFNGPPASGNGGYSCGVVARLVGSETAQVSLRAPPPLDRPLSVVRHEHGRVELQDDGALVAEGEPAELLLEVPEPIPPDEARRASEAGLHLWTSGHPFPTCVVCGPERASGDGFRIFPGALPAREGVFAMDWTPDASLADDDGLVRSECIWAALDCPTAAPVANFGQGPAVVLGRLTARLAGPVSVEEPHTILSWPLEVDGRKRHAAAALYDAAGRLLCASRALWIELRGDPGG